MTKRSIKRKNENRSKWRKGSLFHQRPKYKWTDIKFMKNLKAFGGMLKDPALFAWDVFQDIIPFIKPIKKAIEKGLKIKEKVEKDIKEVKKIKEKVEKDIEEVKKIKKDVEKL